MDVKHFYQNLFGFFAIGAVWAILDVITGNKTDLTDLLIMAFFLVWNLNQSKARNSSGA